jgi:signal transduction histidine kinase
LEALAQQFNHMAANLQTSYAELEHKVEERTAELSEALEQQTATAEVLQVINASPGDIAPVFDALLDKALHLCKAAFGILWTYDGECFRAIALRRVPAAYAELLSEAPYRPEPGSGHERLLRGAAYVEIKDVAAGADIGPVRRALVELGGARTVIAVPLLKDGAVLGAVSAYRQEVRPFSEKQIALLQNFAAQAVIAMENARLLGELRERTQDLARSVEELKALREVGQAVNSTLDLRQVLSTILTRSVTLAEVDAGVIFRYSRAERAFHLVESVGWDEEMVRRVRGMRVDEAGTVVGQAVATQSPVQLPDIAAGPMTPLREVNLQGGFHAALIVPLIGAERTLGAIVLARRAAGEFPEDTVRLMQTLASQSALAIQNARLYREIAEKSEELALASQHKSQFLANMSHELRTPLNAILGYAELLVDGIYGTLPERVQGVLERVQNNGKHLLALINDVLDLSKIEAGQLTLVLEEYSLAEVVHAVTVATEPLAATKGLAFAVTIADGLPNGYGDARRLSQVLLNLVGNAIKFTDAGEVTVSAEAEAGQFVLTVRDTGPGIAPEDQDHIFGEFHQVDNSNTRQKGGTGLGLAISKRLVAMQGGGIAVESQVGRGSTFRVTLPIRVEEIMEVA